MTREEIEKIIEALEAEPSLARIDVIFWDDPMFEELNDNEQVQSPPSVPTSH